MKPLWVRKTWDHFSARFPRLACDLEFLRRNRRFEPDLWLIPRYCRRDTGAIDVGANMGIFSRWMARHAGRVDSFECNPHLFPHLQRFLPRNVSLHRCALSSAPGRASLRFDPGNTGIGTIESANRLDKNPGIRQLESVDVELRRLDDIQLGPGPVSFIKIDVEGHELEVLKGARQLLEQNRPVLLIEIEERHCPGNLKAVPLWLAAMGYEPRVLGTERKLTPAPELESLRCNNFWFLPRSATFGG